MKYYCITFIIIILIMYIFFFYNNKDKIVDKEYYSTIDSKEISYPYYDDSKYLWEYDGIFGGLANWYNRYTPLPFNNPTRYYGYKTTLYPLIHDYYYPIIRHY